MYKDKENIYIFSPTKIQLISFSRTLYSLARCLHMRCPLQDIQMIIRFTNVKAYLEYVNFVSDN